MPAAAAVARGIILSIGIIAALGVAVMENPHVQEWVEQQRKKIVELLRTVGEDLDPQSRRTAEAFAFGGRPLQESEAQASADAAAVATGRSMSTASSTTRRIPISGPTDPDMAVERRRMGQAYLVKREQQMIELQQRRSLAMVGGEQPLPPSSPSTESPEGEAKMKGRALEEADAKPITAEQLPEQIRDEARLVEKHLDVPVASVAASSSVAGTSAAAAATSASGWQWGSSFANPFGDEFEMDRSITPRPPTVPPKVALSVVPDPEISIPQEDTPMAENDQSSSTQESYDHLSYEEQLAVALSLSEQESSRRETSLQHSDDSHEEDDANLRAAIAASLREMDPQQAAHAVLVDVSSSGPIAPVPVRQVRSEFESLFANASRPAIDSQATGTRVGLPGAYTHDVAASRTLSPSEASDELYRITPQLTRARLASLEASHREAAAAAASSSHTSGDMSVIDPPGAMDARFYSAVSLPTARSETIDHETPSLVDVHDDREGAHTPTLQHSLGYHPQSEHDLASVSTLPSEPAIVVEDVPEGEDSDIDVVSANGEGIHTPDSWSEIDEHEAESQAGDEEDDEKEDHMHHHSLVGA